MSDEARPLDDAGARIILPAGVADPRVPVLKVGDAIKVRDTRDGRELDAEVILPSRFGPADGRQYTFGVIRVRGWGETCDPIVLWVESALTEGLREFLESELFWGRHPIVKGALHDGYYMAGVAPAVSEVPSKDELAGELKGFWIPQAKKCFDLYQAWIKKVSETSIDTGGIGGP